MPGKKKDEKDKTKAGAQPTEHPRRAKDDELHGGNPPRTTRGGITAPKFGSAGSGGAEFEPGPERD